MKKFFEEFKAFAMKGNVVDMAVGVIIGGAFGKIVTSLVNDVITPLIGVIIGGHDFTALEWKIGEASVKYGVFIQNVIDFLIIALCIFCFIKLINKLTHLRKVEEAKEEAVEEAKEPEKAPEVQLLEEIRDLLKKE